jgi:hypothetical protein
LKWANRGQTFKEGEKLESFAGGPRGQIIPQTARTPSSVGKKAKGYYPAALGLCRDGQYGG